MHIPGHTLDPAVMATTNLAATALVGYALVGARRERTDLVSFAAVAGGVLALEAVNFPVAGGVSGHVLGGLIAALVLGPWTGVLAVAAVLTLQCLLLGDGGVDALGANILNIAGAGCLVGHKLFETVAETASPLGRSTLGRSAAASAAAWIVVVVAAGLCGVELVIGGSLSAGPLFSRLLSVHAVIGLGEAVATGAVVGILAASQGSGVEGIRQACRKNRRAVLISMLPLYMACLVLGFVGSASPDGLETSLAEARSSQN